MSGLFAGLSLRSSPSGDEADQDPTTTTTVEQPGATSPDEPLPETSTDPPPEAVDSSQEEVDHEAAAEVAAAVVHQALQDAFEAAEEEPTLSPPVEPPPEVELAENGNDSDVPSPPSTTTSNPIYGSIHPETPVLHVDVALRLLRKFWKKTSPHVITSFGGIKSRSILGYLTGDVKKLERTFMPFKLLTDIILAPAETPLGQRQRRSPEEEDDLEGSEEDEPDEEPSANSKTNKANQAVAAFTYMFGIWSHVSSRFFEQNDAKSQTAFADLLSFAFDTASLLVAHGCLDDVQVTVGKSTTEYQSVVVALAQSVFNADLSIEKNELTAMKFLLSTGCRQTETNHDEIIRAQENGAATLHDTALLRGQHLLQTIRTFYHVYLTTASVPNKTTARAALQQLVTNVFVRLVNFDEAVQHYSSGVAASPKNQQFPSLNHRDAFLVMRSICKLSMRPLPVEGGAEIQAHVGIQSSASHDMWGEEEAKTSPGAILGDLSHDQDDFQDGAAPPSPIRNTKVIVANGPLRETPHLVYTAAAHPALESKILALELLAYVMDNVSFSRGFVSRCGSQFHTAIRNYLCVSLLKNCTSDNTRVVNLSLRIFVPLVRNFRTALKNEIEAFVTNVFFVILDSPNSPAEHKSLVVKTFDEICSDPATLAEIFLNYDCDLSAQDLFHRIVNTLSKVSRSGLQEPRMSSSALGFLGVGSNANRMEKSRIENRDLRLHAMKALRQVLASLHASMLSPVLTSDSANASISTESAPSVADSTTGDEEERGDANGESVAAKQNLVQMYDSKKKRRAEEAEVILRFNQKPTAGIAYAAKCGHIDGENPTDVARFLLKNKDIVEKTQIGEYLGREAEYQNGFCLRVLHEYVRLLDLSGLVFDDAIRFFLSGFRLPGEAQKVRPMLSDPVGFFSFLSLTHCWLAVFRLTESWKNLRNASQNKILTFFLVRTLLSFLLSLSSC
jgi:Guanine nucleotide exchange factor in Golgi transport N-terminal/Sec7 domain